MIREGRWGDGGETKGGRKGEGGGTVWGLRWDGVGTEGGRILDGMVQKRYLYCKKKQKFDLKLSINSCKF